MEQDKYFICSILKDPEDYVQVIRAKISRDLLVQPFDEIFNFIVLHHKQHGKIPHVDTVQNKFQDFYKDPPENTSFYIAFLKSRAKLNAIKKTTSCLIDVLDASKGNMDEALNTCEELLAQTVSSLILDYSDVEIQDLNKDAEHRYSFYEEGKQGITGIPTPWPSITQATSGWQPGDLITLLADTGLGKSFCLLMMLIEAHKAGKTVILFTEEMTIRQFGARFDAIMGNFPYTQYKRSNLSEEKEQEYKQFLSTISQRSANKEIKPFYVVHNLADKGIEGVRSIAQALKADMIGIDGGYLFSSSYGWKDVSSFTGGAKKIANNLAIPVALTNQKLEDSDGAAYSKSFKRDANYMIVMYKERELAELPFMNFRFDKYRELERGLQWSTNWDFEQMDFSEIGGIEETAIAQGIEDDLYV